MRSPLVYGCGLSTGLIDTRGSSLWSCVRSPVGFWFLGCPEFWSPVGFWSPGGLWFDPQVCRSTCRAVGAAICFLGGFPSFRRVIRAATRFLWSSLYMSPPLFRLDSWSPFETKIFWGVGCLLFYLFNCLHDTLFIDYSLIISGRGRNGEPNEKSFNIFVPAFPFDFIYYVILNCTINSDFV